MTAESEDLWTLLALLGHREHKHLWDQRPAQFRSLLKGGADPNAGRGAPLTLAAQMGHLEVMQVLLEYGADVQGGSTYRTPVLAGARRPEVRDLLLRHGAKETPFCTVARGDLDQAKVELGTEPDLVHLADEEGRTLLHHAANSLDLKIMKLLLDAGANPNAVAAGSYGVVPLHEVCGGNPKGGRAQIQLLAQHQCQLDAQDKGGVTALHKAVRIRNVEAVSTLLECGASPDIEDRGRKSTALRRAVANTGRSGTSGKSDAALQIVRLLLQHGADPNHVNRAGKKVIESTRNAQVRALLSATES